MSVTSSVVALKLRHCDEFQSYTIYMFGVSLGCGPLAARFWAPEAASVLGVAKLSALANPLYYMKVQRARLLGLTEGI